MNNSFKNPFHIPLRFDATNTDALLAAMRANPQIAEFTLEQARNAIPGLNGREDGYVMQCLQDALQIAANELNQSAATAVRQVRQWSWLDFVS